MYVYVGSDMPVSLVRPMAGIRGSTLIINLPGSKKGSQECLQMVSPALSHALDLVSSRKGQVVSTHQQMASDKVSVHAWGVVARLSGDQDAAFKVKTAFPDTVISFLRITWM